MKERFGVFRADPPRENWTRNRTSLAPMLINGNDRAAYTFCLESSPMPYSKTSDGKTGAYRQIKDFEWALNNSKILQIPSAKSQITIASLEHLRRRQCPVP